MRPEIGDYDPFYQGYIDRVIHLDMLDALQSTHREVHHFLSAIPEKKGDYRYDENKWTIKEVIGHMMDCERILAYRALRFSRKDYTELPGFEEKLYAPNSNASALSMEKLVSIFENVRIASIDLFESFTQNMLREKGVANGSPATVLALGYIIAGHGRHHLNVLKERYL